MASNYDEEVIADSEEEYGGDNVAPHHHLNPVLPPRSSPEKAIHSDRNFFSTIETVSDFPQPSDKVSSISEFTAPLPPPPAQPPTTSLISSIITSSVARPIQSDDAETITSISSQCPDKPKKRPRPRPRVRQPDSAEPEPEQTNASPAPKVVDTVPTPLVPVLSSERKSKARPLQEVIVLVPPPPKKRPSTSAVPRDIVTVSSSDVEEIPVQKPTKKRKLSTPAAIPSSSRHAGASRKSKTLLLSDDDEDDDDPIQLKGSEPPKSPRLSIEAPHVSSLPTAKEPPATAKPLYDDDRFSDFDPSESTKAPKKPKPKVKTKKAQAEGEGELGGQAAKPKKPRKSKAKSKPSDEKEGDGPTETLDDGFKSKEFIMDSDEELGGSRPNPNPIAGSPTGKRRAQDDIAPPPKRISLGGSDAEGITTREPQTSFDVANLGGEEAAPAPKPDKSKKKRKSKVDKALSKPDDGLQQTVPTEGDLPSAPAPPITADDTMTVEEATHPPKFMKESAKKSKPKSRPSPQAVSAPLPNPPQPSEPRANEPIVDEASEPPLGNVGPTATPAKGSPAPMNDRQSTPMSSSSKGPRGSIPYWRRPNKPLAELLNQATPGSSARASGLHKSIRIAPLHMNRKPPPPPLPPIPKKKPAKKGDGDESDEDDETPKVRLKRLAAEYESLEGLESKRANDRRKEIAEEMARLTN